MTSRGQLIPVINNMKKRLEFECECGHEIKPKLSTLRKIRNTVSNSYVKCSKCREHYSVGELRSSYTMLLVERMALLGDDSM